MESISDWSQLVGQIAHIDHVTGRFFQNLESGSDWSEHIDHVTGF